jgi:hypothetical protein
MATILDTGDVPNGTRPWGDAMLRWSARMLVAVSWFSAALFGLYILAHYGGAIGFGTPERWNETLPRLYEVATPLTTVAIGAHFATGGILLLLGPVQLIGAIRRGVPTLHRWLGRLYVLSAGIAGIGGLVFILGKGTVGGLPMNLGFGLYGLLMVIAAAETYRHARARRLELHRGWAIRLFALAIGSWLYRMEYGFWFLVAGRVGHASDFSGWFDMVMAFFFYLPNLAVAETFIRARRTPSPIARRAASLVLLGATAFLVLATWVFAHDFWLPGISTGLGVT